MDVFADNNEKHTENTMEYFQLEGTYNDCLVQLLDHFMACQLMVVTLIVITLGKLNLHAVVLYSGITEFETSACSLCTQTHTSIQP